MTRMTGIQIKIKFANVKGKKLPFNTFLVSFKTETETVQGETKNGGKKARHVCMCKRSQYNVVARHLKVVHWSKGCGLGPCPEHNLDIA